MLATINFHMISSFDLCIILKLAFLLSLLRRNACAPAFLPRVAKVT